MQCVLITQCKRIILSEPIGITAKLPDPKAAGMVRKAWHLATAASGVCVCLCLCGHQYSDASYHAEGCTTKQDALSRQCSHWAGLCSCCNPNLQLCQGIELARSCICKPHVQHTLGSRLCCGQSYYKAVLTSYAPALLDTCCTARISACYFPMLCCGDSCHRLCCACGPTLSEAGADTLQRLVVWCPAPWEHTLGSQTVA